jgi:hypothetical protein
MKADRRADGRRLVTSFALELLVYPALFAIWKGGARHVRHPESGHG